MSDREISAAHTEKCADLCVSVYLSMCEILSVMKMCSGYVGQLDSGSKTCVDVTKYGPTVCSLPELWCWIMNNGQKTQWCHHENDLWPVRRLWEIGIITVGILEFWLKPSFREVAATFNQNGVSSSTKCSESENIPEISCSWEGGAAGETESMTLQAGLLLLHSEIIHKSKNQRRSPRCLTVRPGLSQNIMV